MTGVRARGRVRRRSRTGFALVLAVLVTGCVVTGSAYGVVDHGEDRYAGQVMDRFADEMSAAVSDRVTRYGETLHDLASAVGAQSDLRKDDFSRITAGLDTTRLPGAAGVTFVVPATSDQVDAVQREWRAQGATELTLHPTPGASEHTFVIFERPFDGIYTLPGVDLAQSKQSSEALRGARLTGELTISPSLTLIRDQPLAADRRQTSITMAVPIRTGLGSAAPDVFTGWIVMPVRGQDFLSQTLLDRGQGAVQVQLAEVGGAVLATETPGHRVTDTDLVRHRTIVAGHRRWEVTTWPTSRLLTATDRGMSLFTLAAGSALTVMLGIMTGVLAGSRSRALDQVEQATAALRRDIVRREHVEAQLREREEELQRLAFSDPLTGLANRTLFYDRLTHALATHARAQRLVAILFIDLDGFKQVNDQLGHHAGDAVLRAVADRLRSGLREVDTVARFGGDEFAIILEGLTTAEAARATAARVIADVQAPIDVNGREARVSTSIGIAISHPGAAADDLIGEADTAMYAAKNTGKNRYVEAQ